MAENNQEAAKDLLDAEEAASNKAQEEREETLRRELEEARARKRRLVDPLQYEMSITRNGPVRRYEPAANDLKAWTPPSKAQLAALEKAGIMPDGITCAGEASFILDTLDKRRMEGLATPRQIRCLENYGFQAVGMWPFAVAKRIIDRLAANSWRLPHDINPRTYEP